MLPSETTWISYFLRTGSTAVRISSTRGSMLASSLYTGMTTESSTFCDCKGAAFERLTATGKIRLPDESIYLFALPSLACSSVEIRQRDKTAEALFDLLERERFETLDAEIFDRKGRDDAAVDDRASKPSIGLLKCGNPSARQNGGSALRSPRARAL